MGFRFCPECKQVVEAKVLSSGYSQVDVNGVYAKRRKVVHLEADGGCGESWSTLEFPEELIGDSRSDYISPQNIS